MPVYLRIEAVGLEEVDAVALQTHAVMAALVANVQPFVQPFYPQPQPVVMPPPPPAFLTATLYLQGG